MRWSISILRDVNDTEESKYLTFYMKRYLLYLREIDALSENALTGQSEAQTG